MNATVITPVSRGARVIAAVGLAATAMGIATMPAARAAGTAPPKPSASIWNSTNTNSPEPLDGKKTYTSQGFRAHGFQNMTENETYYCAQDVKDGPSASGVTSVPASAWNTPTRITGAYAGTEGKYTAESLAEAAYIINKYGNPAKSIPLTTRAEMVTAVDAANGALAGNSKEHSLNPTAGGITGKVADYDAVKKLYDSYIAEAKKYAGDQKMILTVPAKAGAVGTTGKITFGPQANGNYVPGETITVTLSGGATFSDGSTTKTFTSTTAATSATIKYTSIAKASVMATTNAPDYGLWIVKSSKWQNLWKGGVQNNVVKASGTWTATPQNITPKITTQIKNQNNVLTDTITGSGMPANAKMSGTDDLYFVPQGKDVTQANATKVTTVQWSATADTKGAFTTTTQPYTIPADAKPGTYVYWEHLAAGSSGDSQWAATSGTFGDKTESAAITITLKPVVTTQFQSGDDTSKPISDQVAGSGFAPGSTVTGTDDLYFVPYGTKITQGTVPDAAKKLSTFDWTAKADDSGKISATTKPYTVTKPQPGTLVFLEHAKGGSFGGYTWSDVNGSFGEQTESRTVTVPVTISVTTKVNNAKVKVGDTISDTIIGKTDPVLAGSTIKGNDTLYWMPESTKIPSDHSVPKEAQKVQTVTWQATVGKDGTFTATTSGYKVTKDNGSYVYLEANDSGSNKGYTWNAGNDSFGNTAETSTVQKPAAPTPPTPTPPAPVPPVQQPTGGSPLNDSGTSWGLLAGITSLALGGGTASSIGLRKKLRRQK